MNKKEFNNYVAELDGKILIEDEPSESFVSKVPEDKVSWFFNLDDVIGAVTPVVFLGGAIVVFTVAAITRTLENPLTVSTVAGCLGASSMGYQSKRD